MPDDTLRTTITEAINTELEGDLKARLTQVQLEHAAKIKAKVEKALAAIRGKGKAKPKTPRKSRADKGTKRLARGLPKVPANANPTSESEASHD
jgi:hypothetical protein